MAKIPNRATVYTHKVEESPQCSYALDGARINETIWVDGINGTYQAVLDLLGYSQYNNAGGKAWVSRQVPRQFTGFTGADKMYASSVVRTEGLGFRPGSVLIPADKLWNPDPSLPRYEKLKVFLESRPRTYAVLDDASPLVVGEAGPLAGSPDDSRLNRYITRLPEGSARAIVLNRGMMFFEPEIGPPPEAKPAVIPEGVPKPDFSMNITYILHLWPEEAIPWQAIASCSGAINDAAFDHGRFPLGTALYKSTSFRPLEQPGPQGMQVVVDMAHRFEVRYNVDNSGVARGWNYALRKIPNSPDIDYRQMRSYDLSTTPATPGSNPFRYKDLTALFRPDQP